MMIDPLLFAVSATAGRCLLAAGMLLIAAVGPAAAQQSNPVPSYQPFEPVDDVELSDPAFEDMQQQRQAFVREAIRRKIFHRFEPDLPTCEVWVGPRFARLRRVQQTQAASVPWTYCRALSARADLLLLRDGQTDRQIGKFTADGLTLF